jgi:hypothetical protein
VKIGRRSFVLSLQLLSKYALSLVTYQCRSLKSWYSLHTLSSRSEACKMSSNHSVVFRIRVGSHRIPLSATLENSGNTNPSFRLGHCTPQPRDSDVRRIGARLGFLKSLVNIEPPLYWPLIGNTTLMVPRNPLPLNLFFSHDIRSAG